MSSKWDVYRDEWIELYKQGETYAKIAEKFSTDIKTVARQIGDFTKEYRRERRERLAENLVELSNNHDLTYEDVGSVVGMQKSAICNLVKEKKIPYSEKMKIRYGNAWVRLYRDGYSLDDISEMYNNINKKIISDYIKESGGTVVIGQKREKYNSLVRVWKKLYEIGFTLLEIDELFGVGDATIKRYLRENGVELRTKGTKRNPEQVASIRKFLNLVTGSELNGEIR